MLKLLIPVTLFASILLSACASDPVATRLPWVYRLDVQQGNTISTEEIDQLKIGMDKRQVLYLLGTPIMVDPFHAKRWDYIFLLEPGKNSEKSLQHHATLSFEDDKLSAIGTNLPHSDSDSSTDASKHVNVVVPRQQRNDDGILTRLWHSITGYDNNENPAHPVATQKPEEQFQF
ncbi:MAG: outer membrane protein assembly factor BamE [Gammaproteobacteria bacterium]